MSEKIMNIHKIKFLALSLLFILSLGACAGPDRPYTVGNKNQAPSTSGGPVPPPTQEDLGPCAPRMQEVVLKLTAATGGGLQESNPQSVAFMVVRFSSSGEVSMAPSDFPPSTITLANIPLQVVLTNSVTGRYTANPPMLTLQDLVFQVSSSLINGSLPPITLTTGHIEQSGSSGSLTRTGSFNLEDKTITLVGGAPIPQSLVPRGFESLGGSALVIEIMGTFASIPDISTCTGTAAGSGNVQFKNVITETEATGPVERERPLGTTFDFGRIFIPEQGVDTNTDLNDKFFQERRLRVKVPAGKPEVNATLNNAAGFNITPNGNIHIPSGGQQDFTIRFSMPAVPYTSSSPVESADASTELDFGGSKLTLTGKVKRAAPEMVMKSPNSTTIELGDVITPIRQVGSSTRIICGENRGLVQQKVTLKNTGVRELQISRIAQPGPMEASAMPERPDPGCQNFGTNGTEFSSWGLRAENGANCGAGPAPGTLTGACRIPVGEGEVSFKVIYLPVNASNITAGQSGRLVKDQAKMTIQSNDPRYTTNGLTLNLSAGISPDQSDVLKVRRQNSTFEIDKGGVVKVIGSASNNDPTQLVLVNKLNQDLQINDIRVPSGSGFEVLNTADKPKPTRIPASNINTGEHGTASFWVRLNPTGAANRRVFNSALDILFTGGTGQQSTFTLNLVGTFDLPALNGCVEVTADKVTSYIDNQFTRSDTVDSLDYRIKGENVKPGPLRFMFERVGETSVSKVTLVPAVSNQFVPTQEGRLAQMIKALPRSDRAKLFRIYTTRMSGLDGVGYHQDGDASNAAGTGGDGNPDCEEPEGPLGDYQNRSRHCSYFYYIIANKHRVPTDLNSDVVPGYYDNVTGHLVLPDLEMRFVNPYHDDVGRIFTQAESVIDLKATLSTFDIKSLTLNNTRQIFGDNLTEVPLVTTPGIGSNEVSIPSDPSGFGRVVQDRAYQVCPTITEGSQTIRWSPVDPRFDPRDRSEQAKEPKFLCNVTDSAPYYVKGFPVTPRQKENGDVEYKVVMTLLTKYGPDGALLRDNYPQGIPPFLQNSRMWIALQGTMKQCSTGSSDMGSTGSMTGTGSGH